MILQRTPAFTVLHVDTGLTFEVFRVDCFCERFMTEGTTQYIFEERFHETTTGQRVIVDPKGRKDIWIVQTDRSNQYVQKIPSS